MDSRVPEASGGLQKWAIELGEHDIQYKPRVSIKGQAVADLIVEMAENTQDMPNVPEDPSSDSLDRAAELAYELPSRIIFHS